MDGRLRRFLIGYGLLGLGVALVQSVSPVSVIDRLVQFSASDFFWPWFAGMCALIIWGERTHIQRRDFGKFLVRFTFNLILLVPIVGVGIIFGSLVAEAF